MSKLNTENIKFKPKVKLKKINLGKVSGENESKSPDFDQLFYTGNKKYEEICSSEKFIIRGRKGTGKTLLAHYLKKKSSEINVCSCEINTLKDIHLQKLVHLEDREFLEEEYKVFWRYCVLLEIGNNILSKKKSENILKNSLNMFNKDIRMLKKFINDEYENRYKLVEIDKSYGNTKKKNADISTSFNNCKAKFKSSQIGLSKEKANIITKKYIKNEYYENIEFLESNILNILKKEKQGYILIYDDLDELGDNLDEHKNYRKLILGMIFAIQGINEKIQAVNKDSKIIISIRSDILNSLNQYSSNLRKVIADNSVNLYWINKNCSKATELLLIDLILTKIKASIKEYNDINKEILFKEIFPKNISKHIKTENYLLDISMGRPRQVIEFLNMIINDYGNEMKFKPEYFKKCLKTFSPQLYNDLQNEFSVYENKDELNDSLKLIKDLKKEKFEYGEILAQYNAYKSKYKYVQTVEDSLNLMYSFGVIGAYENNGNGNRWSWGYREDSKDNVDIDKDKFIVHKALRHKFNIS